MCAEDGYIPDNSAVLSYSEYVENIFMKCFDVIGVINPNLNIPVLDVSLVHENLVRVECVVHFPRPKGDTENEQIQKGSFDHQEIR